MNDLSALTILFLGLLAGSLYTILGALFFTWADYDTNGEFTAWYHRAPGKWAQDVIWLFWPFFAVYMLWRKWKYKS